jgi:hypothetical protein
MVLMIRISSNKLKYNITFEIYIMNLNILILWYLQLRS